MNTPSRSALIAAMLLLLVLNGIPKHVQAQPVEERPVADEPLILADSNEDEQQRLNPQQLRPYSNEYEYQQHQQQEQQQQNSYQSNAPLGQSPTPYYQGTAPQPAARQSGPQSDALEAARRNWLHKPALPANRNPLLGKWTRPASSRSNSSDPFAQLGAMMRGGLCEVLFGGDGVFEFRPHSLVGIDQSMREQELDEVEYRGDAHHVVVVPKSTFKLMVFDFDGPNRINWSGQNCVLVRAGATSTGAAAMQPAPGVREARALAPAGDARQVGSVLSLSLSSKTPGSINVSGRILWVLSKDAQLALIEGGLQSTPDGTVLQNWVRACRSRLPACRQGAKALKIYTIGIATTDATGHAQSPPLPAARYWIFCDGKVGTRHMMWNQPVDLKGGPASLTLDERNAMPVD
jgi:hypothetical protein